MQQKNDTCRRAGSAKVEIKYTEWSLITSSSRLLQHTMLACENVAVMQQQSDSEMGYDTRSTHHFHAHWMCEFCVVIHPFE